MSGSLLYSTILTDYYITFKHKIYSTTYDNTGREDNLSPSPVPLPYLNNLKTEMENNATGSKYQKIIWNSHHLFADFEPTLNSKLTTLPCLLSILAMR